MNERDQPLLVGAQGLHFVALVDCADAVEEGGILDDRVVVLGQPGGYLLLNLPKLGGREVGTPDAVVFTHPVQSTARALPGLDGIGKGRRLGVAGNGVDLCEFLGHGDLHRGPEVLQVHAVESGHPSVGAAPLSQQDVLLCRGLSLPGLGIGGHCVGLGGGCPGIALAAANQDKG